MFRLIVLITALLIAALDASLALVALAKPAINRVLRKLFFMIFFFSTCSSNAGTIIESFDAPSSMDSEFSYWGSFDTTEIIGFLDEKDEDWYLFKFGESSIFNFSLENSDESKAYDYRYFSFYFEIIDGGGRRLSISAPWFNPYSPYVWTCPSDPFCGDHFYLIVRDGSSNLDGVSLGAYRLILDFDTSPAIDQVANVPLPGALSLFWLGIASLSVLTFRRHYFA
jgi:hypothetical protein